MIRFDGPHTVTGEDLVELHLHGGRAVVAAVSRSLAAVEGVRAAEPGEFTRRAFANGRIDLTEAEGLADLLAAETEGQRRAALHAAGGALGRQVADWTERLLQLAAAVEAQLDFSDEDDVDAGLPPAWDAARIDLVSEIRALLARPPAERLRDGVRVVIAGPPNSGKSTLFNALVGRDAAITSDIAGTTRDLIEAPIALGGVPLLLIDSAGIRGSGDEIETIGVARAQGAIEAADLVLWMGPPAEKPVRAGVTVLHGKADLGGASPEAEIGVSAVTGEGMERLAAHLVQQARGRLPGDNEVSANARQRAALDVAVHHLDDAAPHGDLLISAEELRQARRAFDAVAGRAGFENMLDALFGRFCIGK